MGPTKLGIISENEVPLNLKLEIMSLIKVEDILLIRDTVVKSCNRRFGRETIHLTQKFTSMNLLQMPCVVT